MSEMDETQEIEEAVAAFFATFVSGPECVARADRLRGLMLPEALVFRPGSAEDVESFLAPRVDLLTGGRLTGFSEWPVEGRVEAHGDVAHWFGTYAKQGTLDGEPYGGTGAKSIQLVRTPEGWRISAVAWADD